MHEHDPLTLCTALAEPETRPAAAATLAEYLGGQALLLLLQDPETGQFAPAPGFVLPDPAAWQPFLAASRLDTPVAAALPVGGSGAPTPVQGLRLTDRGVLVLVGGTADPARLRDVSPGMRLVLDVLVYEQDLETARVQHRRALQAAAEANHALEQELAERRQAETVLRTQSHVLETINRVNSTLVAELDLENLVQAVTDAGTDLTGAQFGAFFYNVIDARGEAYTLYTISGVPREAFSRFPMPRNTPVFAPTFTGEGVVRSDDITQDARYGTMDPHRGMPKGHLPVRSYLAVPVIGRTGEVIGGLFFGHAEPGRFSHEHERIVLGVADQAALAIENARLFSGLRAAEASLRALNETLEDRVAERTQALQNEVAERTRAEQALARAIAELEARNRELQEFAYVASHDLQEPLRKVATFSSLLLADYGAHLGAEGQGYVERMQTAATRMSALIRDLLDYSRVSTHGQRFEPTDLNQVIRGVLSDLEVLVQDVQGEVAVDPLPTVYADPTQMRQLFQNLLGNALKFHRAGIPPVVTVRAVGRVHDAEGQPAYRIEVEDNGIGFDEKYLDRIFMPFQRLHGRQEFPGTGIGLAVTKRIVGRHAGTITARSTPGAGSTFVVDLPVRSTAPDPDA